MKRSRLTTLRPRVATLDTRTAKPPPKLPDPHYATPAHRAWAKAVKDRAGWRCEHVDDGGRRCERGAAGGDQLYADHRVELVDDRSRALDPANGQCLCASHHRVKTLDERARRYSRP